MSKRVFCLILCLFSFFLMSAVADSAESEFGENLLYNSDFQVLDDSGLPSGWYTDAWFNTEGYTLYQVIRDEKTGECCAEIRNLGANDARFSQTVSVKPDTLYCLSGWIMADDVTDAGWGANLSIEGLYARTEGLYDTDGKWEYVSLYGITDVDQTSVTVYARLGGYSGESEGTAYFANLYLSEIDVLPAGCSAQPWYQANEAAYYGASESETEKESGPFWPYLMMISLIYTFAFLCFIPMLKTETQERQSRLPAYVWAGLAVSFVLHMILSAVIEGYQVDINCFRAWGGTMRAVGPSAFYSSTSFCDYPPAYLYVLGFTSWVTEILTAAFGGALPGWLPDTLILKFVPCLCDLLLAVLFYRIAVRKGFSSRQAGMICLLTAFHPSLVLTSAAWGQIDSVLILLLVLVAYSAYEGRWQFVLPLYVLSVLVKPQALMLGPLGLLAILVTLRKWDRDQTKRFLTGLAYAAAVALIVILPFGIHMPFGWLIAKYQETLSSYAYATVNAANLYYLFGKNWESISMSVTWDVTAALLMICGMAAVFMYDVNRRLKRTCAWAEPLILSLFCLFFLICCIAGASWSIAGYGAMALAFAIVVPMYLRAGSMKFLPYYGALLFILLFSLGIKMHERYIFPAIGLLMLAFLLVKDRKYLVLLALLTVPVFINEGIVLDNSIRLGSSMGHLNADTSLLASILSLWNLVLSGYGIYIGAVTAEAQTVYSFSCIRRAFPVQHFTGRVRSPLDYRTDASLHWKKLDTVLLLGMTLMYSGVCLWNLGSMKAPQTTWSSSAPQETVTLDLGDIHEEFSMLYFCQVSYDDFLVETSRDGVEWTTHWAEMDQGQCFRWKYLMPSWGEGDSRQFSGGNTYDSVEKLNGRFVRITAEQIGLKLNEVIFRRSREIVREDGTLVHVSGERIPFTVASWENAVQESPLYSSPEAIVDEQDSLEGEPGWYNSTYFDEIYHARTAYEHLHAQTPYETTHPPLGKVIMSWGVALWGMTPFGWRFAGAVAGILMLPGMYLLGKQLTKKTSFAVLSCALMAMDCMHLTQTRIATIDSFPVLFIIFAYWFMLRFMQSDVTQEKMSSLVTNLGFSGFFMGCAIASKWIGVYAGIGLAVLYFWTLFRHMRLSELSRQCLNDFDGLAEKDMQILEKRRDLAFSRIVKLCLWCLLFFVAIPLVIYLLSYIPYFSYRNPQGIGQYLQLVVSAQEGMLSYHSTPGLGMDHPFYSPWYEWPLMKRPMYYAMAQFMPQGRSLSIFCFGNPAVWYTGLAGVLCMILLWFSRHYDTREGSGCIVHWSSHSWDISPAFLMISLLAQFLPWVLVPRGTYIYHYFASVPFLILSVTMSLYYLYGLFPRTVRYVTCVLLLLALLLFIILYPYASGMAVPEAWLDIGKRFLNVYYAIAY